MITDLNDSRWAVKFLIKEHVPLVEVVFHVHGRDGEGTDRGWGQIDQDLAVGAQGLVMILVGVSRGRIEDYLNLRIGRQLHEAFQAFVRGGHAMLTGQRKPLGLRVDADHRNQFEIFGILDHLDHQIGADIARSDDRRLDLAHQSLLRNTRSAAMCCSAIARSSLLGSLAPKSASRKVSKGARTHIRSDQPRGRPRRRGQRKTFSVSRLGSPCSASSQGYRAATLVFGFGIACRSEFSALRVSEFTSF